MKFFENEIKSLETRFLALSKELEERDSNLRFSYVQLATILDSAPLGIIIAENTGKIIKSNPMASSWFSCQAKHSSHKISSCVKFHKKLHGHAPFPLAEIVEKGEHFSTAPLEYVFLETSERRIPAALRIVPLQPRQDTDMSMIFIFDESRGFELQRYRQEFTSILSHQIRAPLTGIRWWIEMLLAGDAGELTSAQAEFLSQSLRSSITLIELVNTMLLITRFESKQIEVINEPVSLPEIVEEVIEELKYNFSSARQNVVFENKTGKEVKVNIDKMMVRQTMFNFLYNAHQYGGQGCDITVTLEKKEGKLRCAIADTGMGIPESEQEAIFEKHFRASNAKDQVPEGTGLGLYLAKMMVEIWGGEIWFESELGKGTTFFITIPLEEDHSS